MLPQGLTPNASDRIIDAATGQFTEIGRILIRNLSAAVGALAPTDAGYVVSHSNGTLSAEVNLGALATGYLKLTTAIGIAVPSTTLTIPMGDVAGLTPALAVITSGTYTPTLFNVANLSASTAFLCQWLRVGATVTVSGKVSVDPVTTATDTQLGISLPIASVFASGLEVGGTAWAPTLTSDGAAVLADVANARAVMQWKAIDVTNAARYFSFTYQVI